MFRKVGTRTSLPWTKKQKKEEEEKEKVKEKAPVTLQQHQVHQWRCIHVEVSEVATDDRSKRRAGGGGGPEGYNASLTRLARGRGSGSSSRGEGTDEKEGARLMGTPGGRCVSRRLN